MNSTAFPSQAPVLLEVRDLRVRLRTASGAVEALDGLSFTLHQGEVLGLVGESGSGKTMAALAILGLQPPSARVLSGTAHYSGRDLLRLDTESRRRIRGRDIAVVFQEPQGALDPVRTCGDLLREALREHRGLRGKAARRQAIDSLRRVHLADPARVADQYPHELSGGMCQRVAIALALVAQPAVLIADEVTSGLDLTVQEQILALLDGLQAATGMGVLLITHDLAVVAQRASRVAVMLAGRIVETGPVGAVFRSPRHPYTRALLRARPRLEGPRRRLVTIPAPAAGPAPPVGCCPFQARCPERIEKCAQEHPPARTCRPAHEVRCFVDIP